jgi:basic amino acid/polyamine antiporter, APA family
MPLQIVRTGVSGGINIVIAFLLVSVSFLVLRCREPDMPRPLRVRADPVAGWAAAVLSLGLAVLYLTGMSAALVWPAEWLIVGIWWLVGLWFVLRLPRVGTGPDVEERPMDATARR